MRDDVKYGIQSLEEAVDALSEGLEALGDAYNFLGKSAIEDIAQSLYEIKYNIERYIEELEEWEE